MTTTGILGLVGVLVGWLIARGLLSYLDPDRGEWTFFERCIRRAPYTGEQASWFASWRQGEDRSWDDGGH